jgi:hypothetical protein
MNLATKGGNATSQRYQRDDSKADNSGMNKTVKDIAYFHGCSNFLKFITIWREHDDYCGMPAWNGALVNNCCWFPRIMGNVPFAEQVLFVTAMLAQQFRHLSVFVRYHTQSCITAVVLGIDISTMGEQ